MSTHEPAVKTQEYEGAALGTGQVMMIRGTSTFDQPVGGSIETTASTAAKMTSRRFRHHRPAWAPALVGVAGYFAVVAVLIVVGEVLTRSSLFAGLRGWDTQVSQTLADHRTSGWDRFSEFGSKSAETAPIVIGGLLVELVLVLRRRWRDLLVVSIGLALELSVFLTVNEIVRRPRPSVEKLGIVPATFSFPSGHAAATIVLYGSIVLLVTFRMRSRLVKVLGWMLVLLITVAVGYARVYRGMHHVTDVTAGALMGLAALGVAVTATRASSLATSCPSVRARDRDETSTQFAPGRQRREQPSSEEVPA
jgi:membrane-associated phospholipid phosphatase